MVTVQQLIDALQAVEDKNGLIEIMVSFEDRIHPIYADVVPNHWGNIAIKNPWGGIRIGTEVKPASLETHYSVREMKNKEV